MAFNPFIGWTQQELAAELRLAQEDFAAGKTITENRSGDVGKREQVEATAQQRIRAILRALSALDPATYPPAEISPDNRTKATFDPASNYVY